MPKDPSGECPSPREFSTWLTDAGLSETTIKRHRINLVYDGNHVLLYADTLSPADDFQSVEEFQGDRLIRKAAWATRRPCDQATMRSGDQAIRRSGDQAIRRSFKANAANRKKLSAFMAEKERVKPEELPALKRQITQEMAPWLEWHGSPDVRSSWMG